MPFNNNEFDKKFSFENHKTHFDTLTEFKVEQDESTDELAVYEAVIASGEPNKNHMLLDAATLRNIARQSNRDTAGEDIPVFPNHNTYDFQIGTMLTGTYQRSQNRVLGTFSIVKDTDTESLRNKIEQKVVRGTSPTVRGPAFCKVCDERMYVFGGCKNDHYRGEVIKVEGKEILVQGEFRNARFVELSVVSMPAMPGTVIFSENTELLSQAFKEGVLSEKALDYISQSYSIEVPREPKPNRSQAPVTKSIIGDKIMAEPTQAEFKLLQDQVTDLEAKIEEKNEKIAEFEQEKTGYVLPEDHNKVQTALDEATASIIEKDTQIINLEAMETEFQACCEYMAGLAIQYFAAIRGVDKDSDEDVLFNSRKESITNACKNKSLTYLIGTAERYMKDYFEARTKFGGQATQENSINRANGKLTASQSVALGI